MTNPQEASLLYPKSGPLFLLAEVQRLTANVADLIDACVRKDQQIAVLEAHMAGLDALKADSAALKEEVEALKPRLVAGD